MCVKYEKMHLNNKKTGYKRSVKPNLTLCQTTNAVASCSAIWMRSTDTEKSLFIFRYFPLILENDSDDLSLDRSNCRFTLIIASYSQLWLTCKSTKRIQLQLNYAD